MKTIRTMEEARRMKIGETARLGMKFKFVHKPFDEEEYRCPTCRFLFYAERNPKFCPGCGARWNGKGVAAVEEG